MNENNIGRECHALPELSKRELVEKVEIVYISGNYYIGSKKFTAVEVIEGLLEKLKSEKQLIIYFGENCDCGSITLHNNGGNYHFREEYIIEQKNDRYFINKFETTTREAFSSEDYYNCWCNQRHRELDEEHNLETGNISKVQYLLFNLLEKLKEITREVNFSYQEIHRYYLFVVL